MGQYQKAFLYGTLGSLFFIGWFIGCDGKDRAAEEGWSAARDPVPMAAQPSGVEVRVLLFHAGELEVVCPAGSLEIRPAAAGREPLRVPTGRACRLSRRAGRWECRVPAADPAALDALAAGRELEIRPSDGAVLELPADPPRRYRGRLHLLAESSDRFAVVNRVDIEDYLAGVIGSEMPSYWHPAALRAQSIASRTYALYQMHIRGGRGDWDLSSDQSSQVYGGVARETGRTSQAIRQTRGVVLTCDWKGSEKLFPAYYSSTCGGHTQDAAAVFGEDLPALKGTVCPYCGKVARQEYYRWAPLAISKPVVSQRLIERYAALKDLAEIADIRVVAQSPYGRVEKLELVGTNGRRARLRAEDFRLAVHRDETPLRSSWYDLADGGTVWRFENGHGWGHGVGLCQCGTQQLARLGEDCVSILSYYYPESMLVRAY
ncbi:MAG: SpoIID/LytB domain-containing protein [Sedimentisphaerales bacterium]|nr:SpoIID/LytB domain-containing protein [Sedimentisphaerales bacterium]